MRQAFWILALVMLILIGSLAGLEVARWDVDIRFVVWLIALCFLTGSTIALLRNKGKS